MSATPEGAPAIGSLVTVPFGSRATQLALVCGYGVDRRGKVLIKVRAWNATQGKWMPNPRPVPYSAEWIKTAPGTRRPGPVPPSA
jgi:hypothetical protein